MRQDIDLDDLKARVPIEVYVASVLPLKKQGRHYAALCPWHQESTPSFLITPERQRFHCFGCGVDGDLFDFIQRTLEVDLLAAIHIVAERAGIPIEDKPEDRARAAVHQRFYDLNAAAALYYHGLLLGTVGAGARHYLEERGITSESVRRFGLGWAPEGDRELVEHLLAGGYTAQEMLATGIMMRPSKGGNTRPTFSGRLLFPVHDARGRTCGFAARVLGAAALPKYMNTPETPVFQKGSLLYGLDLAQDAIRQAGGAVVVEGYLDVIRAHQCSYRQVVGVGGTAVTAEQLLLLRRCRRITLALDGDPSGQHAQIKAGLAGQAAFAKEGKEVALHVAILPPEHDPDSLLASEPTQFAALIAEAPLLMEHVYGQEFSTIDRVQPDWRGRVLTRLRPHLAILPFGLRAHYVRRLAADLQIDDGRLWTELDGTRAPRQNGAKATSKEGATGTAKPRGAPQPPSWLPRIEPGNTASLQAAQDAAWSEGIRRAEEYALGLLLPCAPLEGALLEVVHQYEPGTLALAPYFATLARGGTPEGADAKHLVAAARCWPSVPPEQLPELVLSTLRRAGTNRLRLAAEAGEATPGRLAGALRREEG